MKATSIGLVVALVMLASCGKKDPASSAKPTNAATSNPLTAPADYVGAIGQAQKHSVKTVDLASVSKAIQLFQASEDRYPKDLNELVQMQYLPALPKLPTGMKYQYDANTGQVKAVSQ